MAAKASDDINEIWWGVLRDFGPGTDESELVQALSVLAKAVRTPLPEMVRPAMVRDVCSFLVAPSEKPLIERVKFLTFQEVRLNELSQALRLLPVLPVLQTQDVMKASRHYRIDMVEAAMAFFQSDVVKNETLEDKITFLMRNKELSNVEIDEALDRLNVTPKWVRPADASKDTTTTEAKTKKALLDRAKAFLASDAVSKATEQEVNDFLLKIGLNEGEIKVLKSERGGATEATKVSVPKPELLNRAKTFLSSPAVKSVSEDEVNLFLLKEGLTIEEIAQVREALKVASPASTQAVPPTAGNAKVAEPALSPEQEQRVQRAANFLNSVPRQSGKAEEFLKSKGFTAEEIELAVKRASAPVEDDSMIENAAKFLGTSQAQNASDQAVDSFLQKKGLSASQIDEARRRANRPRRGAAGSTAKSNVDRAVDFLKNSSTQGTPLPDRIAFLRARGLSDAEIQQALELAAVSGPNLLSMNSTNAVSGLKTKRKAPGLPTMCIATVDRLAKLTDIKTDELIFARASFVAAMVVNCVSSLRLPPRFEREWFSVSSKFFNEACHRVLTEQSNLSEEGSKLLLGMETLVADICEVIGTLGEATNALEMLRGLFLRAFSSGSEQDQIGLGLMLSRCVHGHFSSRASAASYEVLESIYSLPKMEGSLISGVDSFFLAAMLRGAVDFGCGVGAPRVPMDEKNERNVSPEKDMRLALNSCAQTSERPRASVSIGAACVYAGLTWLDALSTWQCILDSILLGSLGFGVNSKLSLDDVAAQAVKFVQRSAFKLAATSAQVLCSQCAQEKSIRDETLRLLNEHAHSKYEAARANDTVRSVFAKRMVERTYDDTKSQMSLEDALGNAQGQLGRVYQTQFLVLIVLLEPCLTPDKSLEDVAWTWECVAELGFALVPVPEVLKLNQWLDVQLRLDEKKAFVLLSRACRVSSVPKEADWILAAKLEYLMDTGKRIVKPGWDEASLVPVFSEGGEEQETLAQALVFGAGFPFAALNRRCHSYVTEAVAASCVHVKVDEEYVEEGSDGSLPLLAMAIVPRYIERSVETCPQATDGSSLAFVMGSILTSLSRNPHALAQPIATVAFSKVVIAAHALLTKRPAEDIKGSESFTRETKTRADLLLNLAFSSLKACSLPALAPSLDKLEFLFKLIAYRELHGKQAAISSERMRNTMFGVISRIDDSQRRAILVLWFLKKIQDGTAETTTAGLIPEALEDNSTQSQQAKL